MPTTISIDGGVLRVEVRGLDKLWSFASQLEIPLEHVRDAAIDPAIARGPKGWRGPGSHLPGIITAGTFHQDGGRIFWDVHDPDKAVVIALEHDTLRAARGRSRRSAGDGRTHPARNCRQGWFG